MATDPQVETDLYDQTEQSDAVQLVVKAVTDCERRYHDAFIEKVERRYDAYRGLAEPGQNPAASDDEDWHSNITTPYVLNTCEGMLATMLEPSPRFNVTPRPKPEEPLDEILARLSGVKAIADTLRYANDMEIQDAYGNVVDSITTHEETTAKDVLVLDDAVCEVRDVRDFFWPSQAPNVDKAEYLIDRTWQSFSALKRLERMGVYSNVDKVKDSSNQGVMANVSRRERRLRGIDRTQDMVEVLEYWTPERVITVANRSVLLRDDPNPFWNGRLPFVVCAAMPDAFQIPGISVVEALAQLQQMLWTLQNQRLDVVRLLANLITLIRSDVDDPDAFEWAPNAQWFVEDPGQVDTLKIDPTVANITLQAEGLLKGDLQNIMGGLPMASGVQDQTMDQQTATGMSIITTIAQRIIQSRKQHYLWAYAALGKDFLLLYQQFVRDDRIVPILGANGASAYHEITPLDLQGDYDITIDVTSDSLLRQERRAESSSLLQIAAQVQMVFAQSGAPLNLKAFMEDTLDAYDKPDKDRYFMPPQVGAATAGGQPGTPPQPGQVPVTNGGPGGVTAPQLAAGPQSPSASPGPSMSPEAAMAQLMRMRGGVSNKGGGGT